MSHQPLIPALQDVSNHVNHARELYQSIEHQTPDLFGQTHAWDTTTADDGQPIVQIRVHTQDQPTEGEQDLITIDEYVERVYKAADAGPSEQEASTEGLNQDALKEMITELMIHQYLEDIEIPPDTPPAYTQNPEAASTEIHGTYYSWVQGGLVKY